MLLSADQLDDFLANIIIINEHKNIKILHGIVHSSACPDYSAHAEKVLPKQLARIYHFDTMSNPAQMLQQVVRDMARLFRIESQPKALGMAYQCLRAERDDSQNNGNEAQVSLYNLAIQTLDQYITRPASMIGYSVAPTPLHNYPLTPLQDLSGILIADDLSDPKS